jgi:hypothetical protein
MEHNELRRQKYAQNNSVLLLLGVEKIIVPASLPAGF